MNFATDADSRRRTFYEQSMPRHSYCGQRHRGHVSRLAVGQTHSVTVFERDTKIGHSNTVVVEKAGIRIPVDTGFIVYNDETYQNGGLILTFKGTNGGK